MGKIMEIIKKIEIKISVSDDKPMQCVDCQFMHDEYFYCNLFNIGLKTVPYEGCNRCEQCINSFGLEP